MTQAQSDCTSIRKRGPRLSAHGATVRFPVDEAPLVEKMTTVREFRQLTWSFRIRHGLIAPRQLHEADHADGALVRLLLLLLIIRLIFVIYLAVWALEVISRMTIDFYFAGL